MVFLEEEKHEEWENELAFACEVLRPDPMTSQEVWIAQLGAECFGGRDEVLRNVMKNGSHPDANRGKGKSVQYKYFMIRDLHLIQ
jgi:hypothetical protein